MTKAELRAIQLVARAFGGCTVLRDGEVSVTRRLLATHPIATVQLPAHGVPGSRWDVRGRRLR